MNQIPYKIKAQQNLQLVVLGEEIILCIIYLLFAQQLALNSTNLFLSLVVTERERERLKRWNLEPLSKNGQLGFIRMWFEATSKNLSQTNNWPEFPESHSLKAEDFKNRSRVWFFNQFVKELGFEIGSECSTKNPASGRRRRRRKYQWRGN